MTYLDRTDIRILSGVFVLVQPVFGKFAFFKVNAKLDKEKHHRLQGGDGTIPRPL